MVRIMMEWSIEGFDEEMNQNGYGIEYDIENGKQKRGGVNMNENWYSNGRVGSIRSRIVYKKVSNEIEEHIIITHWLNDVSRMDIGCWRVGDINELLHSSGIMDFNENTKIQSVLMEDSSLASIHKSKSMDWFDGNRWKLESIRSSKMIGVKILKMNRNHFTYWIANHGIHSDW